MSYAMTEKRCRIQRQRICIFFYVIRKDFATLMHESSFLLHN
ncbi:hypothetical protein RUMHYD_02088 [Blautia hydrogenotrophica DSM 10507]|uniref:Uncharacterized protein n=1 Tax=Blautia hydrogenotrophica (strain DSM 10507 / JCM 14656 / S5a33) TaxID=476272 RepID=C0CMK3_BLAHS|nr:hypothetical protein RUMHYD_02088 [Blautia hydrogenotrophica DSM 10507]